MARALMEVWATVSPDRRDAFVTRARATRAALQERGVSYWVFARSDRPDVVVQYVEAGHPDALERARAVLGADAGDRTVVLHQLEI